MSKNKRISPVLYSKCMNRNKYQKFIPQQNNIKAKVCVFMVAIFSLFEEVIILLSQCSAALLWFEVYYVCFIVFYLQRQNCVVIIIP